MHKQEVPLPNIFQYSTVIWWKTVFMQHMLSFKSHKRKITMSGYSEQYVYEWNTHRTIHARKTRTNTIAQRIVFDKIVVLHKGQQKKLKVQYAMYL